MGIKIEGLDAAGTTISVIGQRVPAQVVADMASLAYSRMQDGAGAHSKTGNLRASVSKLQLTRFTWAVGHDESRAPYAQWVIQGSEPHVIRPKHANALRWTGPFGRMFAFRVDHPGYVGDDYVQWAGDAALSNMAAFVSAAMKGA